MTYTNLAVWNVGQLFDYRNVLLRSGKPNNEEIQEQYNIASRCYKNALEKFESSKEKGPHQWWEDPSFHLSSIEKEVLAPSREKKIKQIYKNFRDHCGIVLLQEIQFPNGPKVFEEIFCTFSEEDKNFDYVCSNDKNSNATNTLVAWNKKKFSLIAPDREGPHMRKATWVTLRDLTNGKIVQVASVHIPGYKLTNPSENLKEGQGNLFGDNEITNLLEKIQKEEHRCDVSIIAGDFNGEYNPSDLEGKNFDLAQRRFTLLEEKGFVHAENAAIETAFNFEKGLCQLDHVMYRATQKNKSSIRFLTEDPFMYPLEDVSKNPSDHRPLFFILEDH